VPLAPIGRQADSTQIPDSLAAFLESYRGYGQPPDEGQLSSYLGSSSEKHCPQVDRSNRRSQVTKTGFDGWDSR
jgi:hypothetical protein